MKKLLKPLCVLLLAFFARAVVRRYRPRIVMVTGSVGKTATKDAIATVLATRFYVRSSEKSFNSEFGVPFTILGVENPWKNPFAWVVLIKNAIALLILPNHYPNMLVLEVGSGKPGDCAQILKIATPHMVVVTRLPEIPVHVEAYASPEAVREEEFSPAYALYASAPLIIPADDSYALDNATRTSAHTISYGMTEDATVRISDAAFYEHEGKVAGMQATAHLHEESKNFIVKGSVGTTQLLPVAAALAVASAFEMPLVEAFTALENYEPPPGRGRLLKGKNGSLIIDDSYNSSPAAVEEALATLKIFPHAERRIAVLGDMLELGRYSVMEHGRISTFVASAADVVATVGIRARAFAPVFSGANASREQSRDNVLNYENSRAAARALPDLVRAGDVVLVKGSQSVRTERIVEALLADPADSARLVRQEKKWKQKS